jgi:glycosyltransferase involved in cell wall biosynthesis
MELVADTTIRTDAPPRPRIGLKPAQAAIFGLFRRALVWRARDITRSIERRSALVIAPHPDDETLGCGATIARKTAAGTSVHIVFVTDGRRSHRSSVISPDALARLRRAEALEAAARLGVPPERITFLDVEDGRVGECTGEIQTRLLRIIEQTRPEDLFIPFRIDRHPDHQDLGALLEAIAASERTSARILAYPIWFWTLKAWCAGPADSPRAVTRMAAALVRLRPVTVRTRSHLATKRHALAAHRSQTVRLTDEPSWAVLDAPFLGHFFSRSELFFELAAERGATPAASSSSATVRVLHMLPDLQVGGGQQLLLRNITAMDGRFAHHVCAIRPAGGMEDQFAAAGVRIVHLDLRAPWQVPGRIAHLARAVRHLGIDVIHTNNTGIDKLFGQIAALACRVPVVNTVHSDFEPPTTGAGLKGAVLRAAAPARSALEEFLGRLTFAHAIAVSAQARESWAPVLRRCGLADPAFSIIHPAIDPAPFERPLSPMERASLQRELSLEDGGPVLLCIGRLVPGKGQRVLISALPRILEQHPRTTLLLAGDGPYREELAEMTRRLGCENAVRFLGTRHDIPELLQLCDLAVFPSFREGFGLVLLEAMAAAKPVLASRLKVFEEIVTETSAERFTPGDSSDLAAKAGILLGDPPRLQAMGAAGRDIVRERFSLARTARSLEAVYDAAVRT